MVRLQDVRRFCDLLTATTSSLVAVTLMVATPATAENKQASNVCASPDLQEYLKIDRTWPETDFFQKNDKANALAGLRRKIAQAHAASFLAGQSSIGSVALCLPKSEGQESLLATIQQAVLQESLREYSRAQSPALRKLSQMAFARTQEGASFPFILSGTVFADSPAPWRAGHERSTGAIYVDTAKVPSREWLVILAHELLHGLDDQIVVSVVKYSNTQLTKQIASIASRTNDLKSLSSNERALIQSWILAGLNKGLLAEYRAWAATDVIYRAGAQEGLWPRIPWIDKLTDGKNNDDRRIHLMRTLIANKTDPAFDEGLFQWPVVQAAYFDLLKKLSENPKPCPIKGSLADFLN